MKIYGHPKTRSLRAVWAAEEAGLEYDYHKVRLMRGEHRQADYLQLNPGSKVPTLVDGDLVLTESYAICSYLGSKAPGSELVPDNADDRATYDQWCSFAITELEQPLWTIAKHTFVLPEVHRRPEIMDTAEWEFARAARVLSEGLADRPYILGETFTVADILLAHTLRWAANRELAAEQRNLQDYLQRCTGRVALQRANSRENGKTV